MQLWDSKNTLYQKAYAMYGVNKSFREIEAELHIPRSSLHRRALAEGWKKGFLMPLVHEMVRIEMLLRSLTHTANLQSPQTRIEMLLRSLTPTQRKAVEAEVKRLLKLKELDQANPNPWLKRLMK